MPVREQRRPPASPSIIIHKYAYSEPSASPRISDASLSSPEDSMQGSDLACHPEQLDYPASILDSALFSTDYSMQGFDFACNPEQLNYPTRPRTTDCSM